jgi:hypothetical protein
MITSNSRPANSFLARLLLYVFLSLYINASTASFLTSSSTASAAITHCGTSPAEAQVLGCHFDVMSFAYYPPACWDAELHSAFVSRYSHDWRWKTEDYEPISVADVLKGNHTVLRSAWEFHSLHCTYEWQRLIRALAFQRPLDRKLANFGHSHHCSQGLLKEHKKDDEGKTSTTLILWFGDCGLTAEEMGELSEHRHVAR